MQRIDQSLSKGKGVRRGSKMGEENCIVMDGN